MTRSIKVLLVFLFISFSNGVEANQVIDSLLIELTRLEPANDLESLEKKSVLCKKIADAYNILFSDQDLTGFYLFQAIQFREQKIQQSPIPQGSDQLELVNLYRETSLFEAFRGDKVESGKLIEKSELLLLSLKFKIPETDFIKAVFDFYHSCFALHFAIGDPVNALAYIEKATVVMDQNELLWTSKINIYSERSLCLSQLGLHDESNRFAKLALDLYYANPPADQPEDRFVYFYLKSLFLAGKYQDIATFVEGDPNFENVQHMEDYLSKNKELASRSFFELVFLVGNAYYALYELSHAPKDLKLAYEWCRNGFILAEKLTVFNEGDKIGNTLLRPKDKLTSLMRTFGEALNKGELKVEQVDELIRITDVYQSSRLQFERLSHTVNSDFWAKEKALKNELTFINLQLLELKNDVNQKPLLDSLTIRFNQLAYEYVEVKKKTKRDKVLQEYGMDNVDFSQQLRNLLVDQEKTLLTYFYSAADSQLYILGINPEKSFFNTVDLEVDLKSVILKSYELNAQIQFENSKLTLQDSLNTYLYKILIGSIKDDITTSKLLIYPLHELSYVSFDALLDSSNSYLVEHYAVQYTSSLFALILGEPNAYKNPKITCFYPFDYGSDSLSVLKNAEKEVNRMEEELGAKAYRGAGASKSQFLKLDSKQQIIHIASHSILDRDHPYESYIVFDQQQDSSENRLFAYEIFSLSLQNKLITLSSCNSANGELEEGIGVVSLANAFTFAGVPATVSSLWSAQDQSSSEIMMSFYRSLQAGLSKSESLQIAKVAYLENADKIKRQPFFWANYMLYGDDAPLFEPESKSNWLTYLIGFVGAVLLFFVGRYYFKSRKRF